MKYSKPALTADQQADRLLENGLVADRQALLDALTQAGCHRFGIYLHVFRDSKSGRFHPGSQLSAAQELYDFDRELRLVLAEEIGAIELAFRKEVAGCYAANHGPFLQPENLQGGKQKLKEMLDRILSHGQNANYPRIRDFQEKYGSDHPVPIWMLAEFMSFGDLIYLFTWMIRKDRKYVSKRFGLSLHETASWMRTLKSVRNICAHHHRLWNITISHKPKIALMFRCGKTRQARITNDTMYTVLVMLRILHTRIWGNDRFRERMVELIADYPNVPLVRMGFPEDWSAGNSDNQLF